MWPFKKKSVPVVEAVPEPRPRIWIGDLVETPKKPRYEPIEIPESDEPMEITSLADWHQS